MRIHTLGLVVSVLVTLGTAPPSHAAATVSALAERLGVTPQTLCIAQANQFAAAALQRLEANTELRTALGQKWENAATASQTVATLNDQLSLEPDSDVLPGQLATALTALQSANDQVEAAANVVRDAMLVDLSAAQRQVLNRVREVAHYRVPIAYGVLERTSDQWHAIETALCAENRSLRTGETLDAESSELLTQVRSDSAVLLAQQNVSAHAAATEQVFVDFDHLP